MRKTDKIGLDKYGRLRIRLTVDLPPSDNKIYVSGRRGVRFLSSKANKFKISVADQILKLSYDYDGEWFLENIEYEVIIRVFFPAIENKGWVKGNAKSRYKKSDATNRQKLVIDAVMEGIGVDDSHISKATLYKKCDQDDPRLLIILRERFGRD